MKRPDSPSRIAIRAMTRDGMTPREIAELMGISTQAVYKHLTAEAQAKAKTRKRRAS